MQSGLLRQCLARVGPSNSRATFANVLRKQTHINVNVDGSAKGSSRRLFGATAMAGDGGRTVTTAKPTKQAATKIQRIDTNPPRGTRDFAPQDMRLRNWLFGEFRKVSLAFGFEEFDAPVLESEELYVRKAGEEITGQLYNFEDKGGRRVALRPELTPSLARLILAAGKSLPLPAKWFAIGQCWRYERMTRGRRREHYQWNMDIVGVEGVEAEAELLAAITTFFSNVGITSKDVGIKINNRKVLQAVLEKYDTPEELFAPVCVVVDKLEKIPREKIVEELEALGLGSEAIEGLLNSLTLTSLEDLEAVIGGECEAFAELKRVFELAEAYGYADWLVFDASVVRGLAYYTGTVFEGFDRAGELRAICGGGRYDKLLTAYGGADSPMVGFGFGDAVIVELLKDRGLLPAPAPGVQDVVIGLGGPAMQAHAAQLAAALRAKGRTVDLTLEAKKMKWAFKQAERVAAERLIIVGEDEWAKGLVRVKNLASREEGDVKIEDV
eukprot:CAMPEP_0118935674 /NCGR_PEP_ID=MMETSP1169-20130426/15770_1 /TAXON_ID=36882 /ORGANISM="Pyramimonas obovata, Strain CCMP722" /LENGTH=496 /DNA_ID=CAMNT_0006878733 /DNA_START=132 /DNA_END=1622 /DNA_ORIENTATION=+